MAVRGQYPWKRTIAFGCPAEANCQNMIALSGLSFARAAKADGLAFAGEAQKRFEVIGVIYISGGFRYPMPESTTAVAPRLLAKPFVPEMLVEAVTAMVAEWNSTVPKHC